MCGSGSGAVLEQSNVALLPPISSKLNLTLVGNPGDIAATERFDDTFVTTRRNDGRYEAGIHVGDSREGWVDAFQAVIDLAMFTDAPEIDLKVHLGAVREKGASAASRLNFRVNRGQLTACVIYPHLPVHATLGMVNVAGPSRRFSA